jgi:lysophospholipase L1-like esterase
MCRFLISVGLLLTVIYSRAQVVAKDGSSNDFSAYYWQRASHFETLPKHPAESIFIGDSLTDGAEWPTLFHDASVINMGISGDVSAGLIARLPTVARRKPKKVFILIGINDLARNISTDSIYKNILLMVQQLKTASPETQVFVQSLLPVNNQFKTFAGHTNKGNSIIKLNASLVKGAETSGYTFVNLFSAFCNKDGKLRADYTNDGLHLRGAGYMLWAHLIYPHLNGVETTASLIPKPQKMTSGDGLFPIYRTKYIYYKTDSLKNETLMLRNAMAELGIEVEISKGEVTHLNHPYISLEIGGKPTAGQPAGAYQLKVDTGKVTIKSTTRAGLFYGVQTLRQLMRDGCFAEAVDIQDSPAFAWRGYMVDVGRNYQSVKLLKQQIDVMAVYKLNVFHMHLTEDIAWRLQIKRYPQLTWPEYMERNKGMYYTIAEIKDLINYCRERHILFVPEIDMPGHSAAFTKAMKVDMQSDSGLVIVKNILKELCETYNVPYIHIGADEVKITNPNFLPQVCAYLKTLNRKMIGWEPGGNFAASTIRQLWMDDAGLTVRKSKIQYIDSRHLYLNHMDPLESVVTIFNRQLAGVDAGNQRALGATLCLWPDRAVAQETDVLQMNAVYPAMLAFAERSWLGKGYSDWVANINNNGEAAAEEFNQFENRLLEHKKLYFKGLSFPYQKQADVSWQLYGPYANQGKLDTRFKPENAKNNIREIPVKLIAVGGTVILRHWWAPKIKGVLPDPAENTTWYASRKIWSASDTVKNFWIGFSNPSRSQATDSPPAGEWDTRHSAVWVNNVLINPPAWLHAGQKGNLEIPYTDEAYQYRIPTAVKLKKGWNTVLIKAPIGRFAGKDWNNPEKWMFTFVEVADDVLLKEYR